MRRELLTQVNASYCRLLLTTPGPRPRSPPSPPPPPDEGVRARTLRQRLARRHRCSDLSAHAPLSSALHIHKSGCAPFLSGPSYRIFMVHPHPERI